MTTAFPPSRLERWPVTRQEKREPLPHLIRLAVGRRDNFTCRVCHTYCPEAYEVDHIVPWSAGGSDDTTNLRVLCVQHNQEKSNFRDTTYHSHPYPATWWCVECWSIDEIYFRAPLKDTHGRVYYTDTANRVEDGEFVAYCATCQHLSWTDCVVAIDDGQTFPLYRRPSPGLDCTICSLPEEACKARRGGHEFDPRPPERVAPPADLIPTPKGETP